MPEEGQPKLGSAGLVQGAQALIIQNHCLAIERQPLVDFSGQERLAALGGKMNGTLTDAKKRSTLYLGSIQKDMIQTFGNVDRFANLNIVLPRVIAGKTTEDVLAKLLLIERQAHIYHAQSVDLADRLSSLREGLQGDAASFMAHNNALRGLTEGDKGVLGELDSQLANIDGKIGGAIAGAAVSGLAIAGGIFIFAVGAISGFVTAGTSAPVALIGATLVVGGIAGAVGSGVAIGVLVAQKNTLLSEQARLRSEVAFATGLTSSFTTLGNGAAASATAAQSMANAWSGAATHLQNLAKSIKEGRDADEMLEFMTLVAEGDMADLKRDMRIIGTQLTGAGELRDEGAPLSELSERAQALAEKKAANDAQMAALVA